MSLATFRTTGSTRKTAIMLSACLTAATVCLMMMPPLAIAATRAAAPDTAIGKSTSTRIEDYVQQQASASRIPGVAVGIVQSSRPELVKGFGNAGPDTSFFLGSLAKSFTALAIMQLADQGKVSLNAPVRRYIPWFRIGDGSESDSITVLQLLDQTSGISNKAGLTELSFIPRVTFQQAIEGFETFPLTARPGKLFQYSDANYTIAGYIVQQMSGQSYNSYVQQHIFAPLRMTHSYAMTGTAREPGLTRGHANWFGLKISLTDQVAAPLVPTGFIISSASDMTHYLIAQMNGGVYDGTRIVSAKAIQKMHTALVPLAGRTTFPNATSYGLGWAVGTINGASADMHDGNLRDFEADMSILPEQKIAVVMLINEDPAGVLNDEQVYDGIMQGITTGAFPAISRAFIIFYAIFDAITLATLILMTRSFWRTGKWLQKFGNRVTRKGFRQRAIRAIVTDLAIAVMIAVSVLYGLGSLIGYVPLTPTLMLFSAPDITAWIFAIIIFFVIRAVVRAIVMTRAKKRIQGHVYTNASRSHAS